MDESTYQVRKASLADVAELARLRWTFRVEDQPGHIESAFIEDCQRWLRRAIRSGRWVIAVSGSDTGLLGCMYLQCIEKVPSPGGVRRSWGYVTNCYVVTESRGIGIGRSLLDLLIGVARTRRLEFLIVWPSDTAVSFFGRAGFRPLAEVHGGQDNAPPLTLVLPDSSASSP